MPGYISPTVWFDKNVKVDPTAKIYHYCVLRDNVEVGAHSVIGHLVLIERDTKIGHHTTIQSQCHITGEAIIGDNCFFGPGVVMSNEKNIANQGRTEPKIEGPVIGDGVRIGAGSVIAPGVKIGDNAFVHAASFVTKDIPAGEIWGTPKGCSRAQKVGVVPAEEYL